VSTAMGNHVPDMLPSHNILFPEPLGHQWF